MNYTEEFRKSFNELNKSINKDSRLNYFKNKLLEILDEKEKKQDTISKAIDVYVNDLEKSLINEYGLEKGRLGTVGEIRTWKDGKKYKKMPDGKWVRVYQQHDRHAEISIARLKGKVKSAKTVDELYNIVMNNIHRFEDENGKILSIVEELKKEVVVGKQRINSGKPTTKEQIEKFNKEHKESNKTKEKITISDGEIYYPDRKEYVTRVTKNGRNYDIVENTEYIRNRYGTKDFDYGAYDTDLWEKMKNSAVNGKVEKFDTPTVMDSADDVDNFGYDNKRHAEKIKDQVNELLKTDEERAAEQDEEKKQLEENQKKLEEKKKNIEVAIRNLSSELQNKIKTEIQEKKGKYGNAETLKKERYKNMYDPELLEVAKDNNTTARAIYNKFIDDICETYTDKFNKLIDSYKIQSNDWIEENDKQKKGHFKIEQFTPGRYFLNEGNNKISESSSKEELMKRVAAIEEKRKENLNKDKKVAENYIITSFVNAVGLNNVNKDNYDKFVDKYKTYDISDKNLYLLSKQILNEVDTGKTAIVSVPEINLFSDILSDFMQNKEKMKTKVFDYLNEKVNGVKKESDKKTKPKLLQENPGRWNGKVYGSKKNGYSIYIDGKKINLSESDYKDFGIEKSFTETMQALLKVFK